MTDILTEADIAPLLAVANARAAAAVASASSLPSDPAGLAALLAQMSGRVAALGATAAPAAPPVVSDLPALNAVGPANWTPGAWNILTWMLGGQDGSYVAANVRQVAYGWALTLNAQGEAAIQTTDAWAGGLLEGDLTLPVLTVGQDAGFYCYEQTVSGQANTGCEIDFEWLSRGLWLCVHQGGKQVGKFVDEVNHGGERVKPSFSWKPGQGVSFALNGDPVWQLGEADLAAQGMIAPDRPMSAYFANSAFVNNEWSGNYVHDTPESVLVAHGFRYTQQ